MLLQSLIVAALVTGCASYALWVLMPAAWRRGLALQLLRVPALARRRTFQQASKTSGGCAGGCDGCGAARVDPDAPNATSTTGACVQPIKIVRQHPAPQAVR